jgi:NADH-ubiquinone oxidoreductase chain 2
MLLNALIILLLSNSITLRRDKSILYSRATITILLLSSLITYDNLYFLFLNKGIGIYGGLFHSTATTSVFHIFILLVSSVILLLTAFYPRKVWLEEFSSMGRLIFSKLIYYQTIILNKMGEQYKIIEYSLIVLFIVIGAMFLISTSDLVSIFLSIELQSYGLYLLSTIYRDSESATSGGLMYFLLGGLSSCFILLSTGLLYANSGTTNLDSLYIITSISDVSKDNMTSLLY